MPTRLDTSKNEVLARDASAGDRSAADVPSFRLSSEIRRAMKVNALTDMYAGPTSEYRTSLHAWTGKPRVRTCTVWIELLQQTVKASPAGERRVAT